MKAIFVNFESDICIGVDWIERVNPKQGRICVRVGRGTDKTGLPFIWAKAEGKKCPKMLKRQSDANKSTDQLINQPTIIAVVELHAHHQNAKQSCKYVSGAIYCAFRYTMVCFKQGQIHGNPVADGWVGAVMQKLLGIQKCDRRTDLPTDLPTDTARCRVACPRLKTNMNEKVMINVGRGE